MLHVANFPFLKGEHIRCHRCPYMQVSTKRWIRTELGSYQTLCCIYTHTTGLYLALVGVRAHRGSAGQCTVQASLLFSRLAQLFCATACCWLPVVEWRGWKIGKLFEKWELSASEATSKGLTTPWRIQNQRFWVELPLNPKKGRVGKQCGT